MNLSNLLDQLLSPMGVGLIILFLIAITSFKTNPWTKWILLGVFGYLLTLYGYSDQFIEVPPPLVEPLQTLRTQGRNLSILLLVLLIVLSFQASVALKIPRPFVFIFLIQLLLTIKVVFQGNAQIGVFLFLSFLGILFVASKIIKYGLNQDGSYDGLFLFALIAGVFFMGGTIYQYRIDPYPITFTQGRLLGTTGNPQHAAVILALSIPSLFYFYFRLKNNLSKAGLLVIAAVTFYLLYLTGSRTGILMAVLGMLSIIIGNFKFGFTYVLIIGIGALVYSILFPAQVNNLFQESTVNQRITVLDLNQNTRAQVWAIQWRQFQNYPVFGAPLRGDRFRFAENSWLAGAAAVGILGFVFMLGFGFSVIRKLIQVKNKQTLEYQSIRAGIIILLGGSFTEAYLLGNLSYPLLVLVAYLMALEHLNEVEGEEMFDLSTEGLHERKMV